MAVIIDLADAVVAALNAGTFALEFTAVRAYMPQEELQDMGTLRVTVVPAVTRSKLVSRVARDCTFLIDVGVQQKCDVDNAAVVDPLVTLCEAIEALLFGASLTAGSLRATCVAINEGDAGRDEQGRAAAFYPHLASLRQFTAVSRFAFKVVSP